MSQWISAQDLAGLPGMPNTERSIRRLAASKDWASRSRTKGKGNEYFIGSLPKETVTALLTRQAANKPAAFLPEPSDQPRQSNTNIWTIYEAAPQRSKDIGNQRAALLNQVIHLATGMSLVKAFVLVADQNDVVTATLRGWYYGIHGRPAAKDYPQSDWPAVLVPSYQGRTLTSDPNPEAWDYFKADYLRPEQPAASACYERLMRIADKEGWQVPSLKTLMRKLMREIPSPAILVAREGTDALKRSYPPQQRNHAWYHALEAVNADGHTFDVFVDWHGEIVRPVLVGWQDIFSGKFLSWRLELHESSSGYRLSFGDMVERYGFPKHAYVDNGRGIAAKHLTGGTPNRYRFKIKEEDPVGIITQLGIQVHWATPYHGQAKPIERAFRDFCEYVARHPAFAGAYTGNNPMAKPDNYRSRAIPLADFINVLEQEIDAHNARQGRRSAVCKGRSFDDVFNDSYSRSVIQRATEEQRRLWLLAAEGVTARKPDGSIALEGNRYWSDALAAHVGKKLVVRFDPDRLHHPVHAYTTDGRYIGQAECIQAAGFGDVDAAREHARLRRQFVNTTKQQLKREQRMSVLKAAEMLPAIERTPLVPPSKVVKPIFADLPSTKTDEQSDEAREEIFNSFVSDIWEQKKKDIL